MSGSKLNPTCKIFSLETGSKIIALLDATLGLIGIIWFIVMLGKYDIVSLDPFENPETDKSQNITDKLDALGSIRQGAKLSTNHKIIGLTLSALFTLINLTLFVVLLVGVHKRHVGLCLTWFYIRCTVIVFKIIIFVMYLIGGRPLFSQIPFIAFMVIHAYGLWVVSCYIDELRANKNERKVESMRQRSASSASTDRDGIERLAKIRKEQYGYENMGKEVEK